MQPEHMNLSRKIGYFFAIIYAQIKLDARKGYTDLSKAQEKALLPIINEIFSKEFDDLNKIKINYPGIDYEDFDDGLGLQMTITVTKQKVQETLNKISRYDEDKRIKKLWMFFLTVEAVPKNVMVNSEDIEIEYMTLKDLEDKVITADLDYQRKYLSLIEREYSSYFRANTSCSIPQNITIPKDLSIFNDFIQTKEWFPDDLNKGYEKVYNFISSFQNCLLDCTSNARNLLSYMIEMQRTPADYNSHIKIVIEKMVGRLNIQDENFDSFLYDLELLESNHLIYLQDEFQGMVGNVIKTKKLQF